MTGKNASFLTLNRFDHMWIRIILRYRDHSSGHIANEVAHEPDTVKFYMRKFANLGYGDFTIQDGMYHFSFREEVKEEIENW